MQKAKTIMTLKAKYMEHKPNINSMKQIICSKCYVCVSFSQDSQAQQFLFRS